MLAPRRRSAPPSACAFFALLALAAPLRAAVPSFVREGNWIEVKSPRLTVLTDGWSGMGGDLATQLERFVAALDAIHPQLTTRVAVPMLIVAFRDQAEVDAYKPGQTENMLAFFHTAPGRNFLVLNGQPEGLSRSRVVFHEFVHAYLNANFPAIPLWMNEGLAEYYGSCRLTTYGAELGKPEREMLDWLKTRQFIDLSLMFAMSTTSRAYERDNELRGVFYAESYLLTHYLMSPKEDRARRFGEFLAELQKGAVPRAAFEKAFPRQTWDAMTGALPTYLEQIDFEPTRRVQVRQTDPPRIAERNVPLAEVLVELGELRAATQDDVGAREHFEAALAEEPSRARAVADLGGVAQRDGRAADAQRFFEQALALTPKDPGIWDLAARAGIEGAMRAMQDGGPDDSIRAYCRLARMRYQQSLVLDPADLEALGGYGQTFAIVGDRADSLAVARLQRAVELQPGRPDLAASLAVLLGQQGRGEEAKNVIHSRVAPSAGRAAVSEINSVIGAGELARADSLARSEHYVEADSVLTRLLRSDPPTDVRDDAKNMLDRLHDAQAFAAANQRLHEAAMLVNGGKLAAAETILADTTVAWAPVQAEAERRRMLADVRERKEVERALSLVKAGKLADARSIFARLAGSAVDDRLREYAAARVKQLDASLGH